MVLSTLQLTAFKNHPDQEYVFNEGINCIVGNNGIGKTNLLDALNYLAFARTALNATDAQAIRTGDRLFSIRGTFEDSMVIACGYEFRKGKILKVNGKEQTRISDHIGFLPLVFTTPDDSDLIREGSEYRRKFFDGAISQVDPAYMSWLIDYQRTLKQRNEHLKSSIDGAVDHRLLDTYDERLIDGGVKISRRRAAFLEDYIPCFEESYGMLHESEEVPQIVFKSEVLKPDFRHQFVENRPRDILMQRTLLGAHRDSYDFELNQQPLRKLGSQGQQKTFIIALRLAEYDVLKVQLGKSPLLLLDDIFDKLDDTRIGKLVALLGNEERFRQIFITDARKERSQLFFHDRKVNFIELK